MKKKYFRISLRVFYWVVFIAGCLLPVADCFSQVSPPNGINYQAVARDVSGTPLSNQTVTVTFRIRQGSAAGIPVYRGTQSYPTNPFGLFNAVVGQTASDSGAFAGIPWASNIFFLQVVVNGNHMGSTQLLTVPYAFHSSTADSLTMPPPGGFIWQRTADSVYLGTLANKVGIGTISPKQKLHIVDPAAMAPQVLLETSAGSFPLGYRMKSAGGEWLLGKENSDFDLFKIKKISDNFTAFSFTGGVTPKVGIGTSGPQEFFHVRPDRDFTFDSSFVVTSGGKIGIGTVAPGAKLDVSGSVMIRDGTQGNGKIFTSDATGIGSWQAPGFAAFTNMQVFTTGGTFVIPAGVTKIMVEVWGGGGGGGAVVASSGAGGGAGGYGKEIFTGLTPSTSYAVTIGSGGTGGPGAGGAGTSGTASVFNGPSVNISAGGGGGGAAGAAGGNGGTSTAVFNITGQKGFGGGINAIPNGGDSPCGGSGGTYQNSTGGNGVSPGGGGGGSGSNNPGGNGANGRVVVWW